MNRLLSWVGGLTVVALGAFWSFVGISKLVDLGSLSEPGRWIDQFPVSLLAAAAVLEVAAGAAILLGRRVPGLCMGAVLLAAFTIALVARPPAPGQSCGCLGSAANGTALAGMDPHLRNAFLGTLHILGLASVMPAGRSRDRRAAVAPA